MNSRKRADGVVASKSVRDRVAAWRRLLERCGVKATRKRVHALRVVTLRLQAELERNRTDLPEATHEAQAILRFSKQAEKLRRALSPVREFDVWIGKLRGLRASLTETGAYVPHSMQESVRGIDRLEERIKKKRNDAEIKLVAQIGKRHGQFVRASEDVDEALSEYVFGKEAGIAGDLVERFRAVKADFLTFNEENLHEFRKRIKTVRYLAEIHASTDRMCAQISTQMKKMQSAIGEWHDWQELGLEARRHRAKSQGLAELLDTVTAEAFENAVAMVQMISASILGENALKAESPQVEGGKQPARDDQPALEALDKQLA